MCRIRGKNGYFVLYVVKMGYCVLYLVKNWLNTNYLWTLSYKLRNCAQSGAKFFDMGGAMAWWGGTRFRWGGVVPSAPPHTGKPCGMLYKGPWMLFTVMLYGDMEDWKYYSNITFRHLSHNFLVMLHLENLWALCPPSKHTKLRTPSGV